MKTFVDAKSWTALPGIICIALDAVDSLPDFYLPEGTPGLVSGKERTQFLK